MSQSSPQITSSANQQPAATAKNEPNKKKWYLLLSNPSKSNHLGTLLRCAAAFDAHQVLLVGFDKFNPQGSFGSDKFLDIVAFHSWETVVGYLRRGGNDDEIDNGYNGPQDNSECFNNDGHNNASDQGKSNNITIIGILGAYGGGEEIYSPNGMQVYENHDTGFVSLVLPKDSEIESDELGSTLDNANNSGNDANICKPEQNDNDAGDTKNTPSVLSNPSLPIHHRQFSSHVCFIVSKDKKGLPISQARLCDGFVHVPHLSIDDPVDNYSLQSPQSSATQQTHTIPIKSSNFLDTATTLSIVLHHYTAWARYTERSFLENQKFLKEDRPDRGRDGYGMVRNYKENCTSKNDDSLQQDKLEEDDAFLMTTNLWKDSGETSLHSDY